MFNYRINAAKMPCFTFKKAKRKQQRIINNFSRFPAKSLFVLLPVHLLGEIPDEPDLPPVERLCVPMSAPREKNDCDDVDAEEDDAGRERPRKDGVHQDERQERKARLPRVEADVVVLLFEHEKDHAGDAAERVGEGGGERERHVEMHPTGIVSRRRRR